MYPNLDRVGSRSYADLGHNGGLGSRVNEGLHIMPIDPAQKIIYTNKQNISFIIIRINMKNVFYETNYTGLVYRSGPSTSAGPGRESRSEFRIWKKMKPIRLDPENWLPYNFECEKISTRERLTQETKQQ
jgi:hypothetical protein